MRLVFGFVLLLGLGLAGFAVYMAKGYIEANEAELARERANRSQIVPTADVFVTARAIRYGDKLTKEDVKKVRWPLEGIPRGAFTEEDALFPPGQDPRTVLRAMEPGEALMAVKVTQPGQDAGVGSKLSPGMRAFAIRVDVASGVSGFLRPGDRVDVYWTGAAASAAGGAREITKLIQPAIKVIAIDQSADEDRSAPTVARTVTVEVSPVEVAKLAQAQATGRLQLSLVGASEEGTYEAVEVNQRELLGIEEEVVVKQEEERVCTITTRKGAETVKVPVPCTD